MSCSSCCTKQFIIISKKHLNFRNWDLNESLPDHTWSTAAAVIVPLALIALVSIHFVQLSLSTQHSKCTVDAKTKSRSPPRKSSVIIVKRMLATSFMADKKYRGV